MQGNLIGLLRRILLGRIRLLMICVAGLVAIVIMGSALLDEGEVVGLVVAGADDRLHETDLWIIDLENASYLRAAAPDTRWLARLRAQPTVTLSRGRSQRSFRAIPEVDAETLERVNRAMAEKYGLADRLWGHVSDRSLAVAIRLESLDASRELVGNDRNED